MNYVMLTMNKPITELSHLLVTYIILHMQTCYNNSKATQLKLSIQSLDYKLYVSGGFNDSRDCWLCRGNDTSLCSSRMWEEKKKRFPDEKSERISPSPTVDS